MTLTQCNKVSCRHHEANILLLTAARDVADSHFIGDRDIQNNPLPSDPVKKLEQQKSSSANFDEIPIDQIDNTKPFSLNDMMGTAKKEWKLRHTLAEALCLVKAVKRLFCLQNIQKSFNEKLISLGSIYIWDGKQAKILKRSCQANFQRPENSVW